jgi:hypothetical protein
MTARGGLEFRPMQGLLSLADRLAANLGLGAWWHGEEGLREVVGIKLQEVGVPDKPIPLTGAQAMTPRQMAEHAGFIRKRKRIRR